ncbi:MAG TPA: PGPGW domain-containing protein [Stellaceae bacterium]
MTHDLPARTGSTESAAADPPRAIQVGRRPNPRPRRSRWARIAILAGGWFFLVLGVIGLVLPVLQGWLFIAIGFVLLSREQEWARRALDRVCNRFPALGRHIQRAEHWTDRAGARIGRAFRRR